MGQAHVDMSIHGSSGSVVVSALADTAATFTKVPRSVFDEVGLVVRYEAEVEVGRSTALRQAQGERIGDGRTILRELALVDVTPALSREGGLGTTSHEHPYAAWEALTS